MTDVPRRMPPGQAQRLRVIADRDQSLRGGTRWARPVQPRPSSPGQGGSSDNPVITGETHYDIGAGQYDSVAISSTAPNEGALDNPVPATPLAHANGGNAVALGVNSNADGPQSVAVGYSPNAYNGGGIAIGWSPNVHGDQGIAIGTAAEVGTSSADAPGAVAIGFQAKAHGLNSVAIGEGALATDDNDVVLAGNVKLATLVLFDSSGGMHKLVVDTSGNLSTVAYP